MGKKKICIVIPTYNEEENICEIVSQVKELMETQLDRYDFEILIIDNCSKDRTRDLIRVLCAQDTRVKSIFNIRNFGPMNSLYYGLFQSDADCSILLFADFQEPLEMIPKFVDEWEKGYKVVCGIKTTSKENKIIFFLRSIYYKVIKKMSDVEQISNFTGFGLYDKEFLDILEKVEDPIPFIKGIVAEFGFKRKDIEYQQNKRKAGKTSYNLYRIFDVAMLSFTSYTKFGLRIATFFGFIVSMISLLIGIGYFIYKLCYWYRFDAGIMPLVVGIFFFGSIQLLFIGLLGEYIMSINTRIMNRPLVIEEERINFED